MTFDTLLVANRGEIAARIIRTAKGMGLRTVAVYADPDRGAPHVRLADQAQYIGPASPKESYLRADRILEAAERHGAGAIHPGYGLLSEDADFARAVEAAGMAFVGPTPDQLDAFGSKDAARRLADTAGVPMLPGTGLLGGLDEALAAADAIGYPVMLKATAGGGGIGLAPCGDATELKAAFDSVQRLAEASFGQSDVFLERFVAQGRHVEVQVFGDGTGRVVALGDRDCTLQRRHQKVLEEAPAPGVAAAVRSRIHESSVALCAAASYRSAGTVEFIYDPIREEASFLEVNARLQVEHPVTEELLGIDLVGWMLRLAGGDATMFDIPVPAPVGHAVEARVYAEDPAAGHRPSAGIITNATFPKDLRVDGWVFSGTEITTSYDPLLAKLIATGPTRDEALSRLSEALEHTSVSGVQTNIGLLRAAVADQRVREVRHTADTLGHIVDTEPRFDVLRAGTMTTVQAWPGRLGLWNVGVPPSGPMDDRSFRLGNRALGNPEGAPGLECTVDGAALRFASSAVVMVTGAEAPVTLDGDPVAQWEPISVPAGSTLDIGSHDGHGLRTYVLVAGGLDVPEYLGSAATFTLGHFGGHGGRALRPGDVLKLTLQDPSRPTRNVPTDDRPWLRHEWEIEVTEGPHAAPEFFTAADIDMLYATAWEVHFNSARTGVRLIGPRPEWARKDGGEAGLHPSNIHDTPYAVGTLDFTGDMPILLGPDGPSLGGFVCPATVVTTDRWKLGQLRPGDTVKFVAAADAPPPAPRDGGVLGRREALARAPEVTYRRSGNDNVLVEYGPMTLDLGLRLRVHALAERVEAERPPGLLDLTPGIRSLQLRVDPDTLPVSHALALVQELERDLPPTDELTVPSRTIRLPLSWDDPATREATERYMSGVRADAPWCPWNIEFIRRVNGLDTTEDVRRTVFDAQYLVLGLGDVYLGAPVATPIDPRHRLVTTKYNPARTWTPENAVGIGGAYLCIYGMEGPGGYQFVGRTTQVWSRYGDGGQGWGDKPWLLRSFDRISWYPVSAEELLDLRADVAAGRGSFDVADGEFSLAEHLRFLKREHTDIERFREKQARAFAAERAAWEAAGEFDPRPEPEPATDAGDSATVPDGCTLVLAPMSASVWHVDARTGERISAGQRLVTLEAMKMETAVESPVDGEVVTVLVEPGHEVHSGAPLLILREEAPPS